MKNNIGNITIIVCALSVLFWFLIFVRNSVQQIDAQTQSAATERAKQDHARLQQEWAANIAASRAQAQTALQNSKNAERVAHAQAHEDNIEVSEQHELLAAVSNTIIDAVRVDARSVRFYMDGHTYTDVFSKYQQAQVYDAADSAWKHIYAEHHGSADATVYASLYDNNTDTLLWHP